MQITPTSDLVLKYLALPMGLGGRGGVSRFFLLSQGIAFTEKLYDMGEDWATEKARMKSSGENPCATVPVIMADGQPLPQHIAGSRFLAHVHGVNNDADPYKDFVQDMVADEYQSFRNAWVDAAFAEEESAKTKYKTETLPANLEKFNALYENFKTEDAFLSTSPKTKQPLWGDAAIFGLVRDNIITGMMVRDDLKKYPYIDAMFGKYEKIPAVKEWIESKKQ